MMIDVTYFTFIISNRIPSFLTFSFVLQSLTLRFSNIHEFVSHNTYTFTNSMVNNDYLGLRLQHFNRFLLLLLLLLNLFCFFLLFSVFYFTSRELWMWKEQTHLIWRWFMNFDRINGQSTNESKMEFRIFKACVILGEYITGKVLSTFNNNSFMESSCEFAIPRFVDVWRQKTLPFNLTKNTENTVESKQRDKTMVEKSAKRMIAIWWCGSNVKIPTITLWTLKPGGKQKKPRISLI